MMQEPSDQLETPLASISGLKRAAASSRFSEARFILLCARASLSDPVRQRVRETDLESLNWTLVLDLARFHGVGPLLWRSITATCADLVPPATLTALRRVTQAGMLLNGALARETVRISRAFEQRGLPAIPFKGATLAAMAYENANLRDFDDLDFIVPQARLAEAQKILSAHGYRALRQSRESFQAAHYDEPYHLYVHETSRLLVDLQWVMAHEQFSFRLDRSDIWERQVSLSVDGGRLSTIAPEELLIILCVHGSKHAWERLKWIVDVAALIRTRTLDWDRVWSAAKGWKCRRMLLLGLRLAQQTMNTALPPALWAAVRADPDVLGLAARMPKSLLFQPEDGIDEHDGPALYYALKDTRLEQWRYALALCRDDHRVVHDPPEWFRQRRFLQRLARTVQPLRSWTARLPLAKQARRGMARLAGRSRTADLQC
ncbi:MAG: nucleotidyltransferase family protein [Nitrospira sp.]|nr:nucleotidyltransferase family protein [Nitrospira sp.]